MFFGEEIHIVTNSWPSDPSRWQILRRWIQEQDLSELCEKKMQQYQCFFFVVNGCKMVLFRFHKNWSILCHESGDSARVSGCRWHDATGCHRPPQLATRPGWEARNGYSNHSFYMFLYTKTLKTFFCCTVFTPKKPPPHPTQRVFPGRLLLIRIWQEVVSIVQQNTNLITSVDGWKVTNGSRLICVVNICKYYFLTWRWADMQERLHVDKQSQCGSYMHIDKGFTYKCFHEVNHICKSKIRSLSATTPSSPAMSGWQIFILS